MTAQITNAVVNFRQPYGSEIVVHTHHHPAVSGQRITHLAVDPVLSHAWINLTGEPFRPHHAATLMAMRRQEHVAIVSANPRRTLSLICMVINVLIEAPARRAMLVVHDEAAAMALYRDIIAFVEKFSHDAAIMPVIVTDTTGPMATERLLIVTYDALHRRILAHHDRAWRGLWQSLSLCGFVDMHAIAGIGVYHMAALLKRMQRIVQHVDADARIQYIATLVPAGSLDELFTDFAVGPWKVVHANDYGYEATHVEIWHRPDDYIGVAQSLAHDLSTQGYAVHLWVRDTLQPLLAPIDVNSSITSAARLWGAHVLVMVGVADDRWRIAEAVQAGYTMIVIVLGSHPLDCWYAENPTYLVDLTPPAWPAAALNAYVLTQHLRTAAYEIPLTDAEIRQWYAGELRDRLVERGQLLAMPDQRWSVAGDDNVYDDFHMLSAIGLPVLMQIGDMTIDTPFDPTGFERWLARGSSVPPWYGGLRVVQRNDDDAVVTLQHDVPQRRTMPLRTTTVAIRDSKETAMLARGVVSTYGRVLVTESVVGVREVRDGAVKDHTLTQPLESRWSAHAWWIDIPTYVHTDAQTIGWSVILALPVLSMFTTAAAVPCADLQFGRLYFVDAQPGGNGASEWMFRNVDVLLQTALRIAKTMQRDVLYAQSATNDAAWLELVTPAPVRHTSAQPAISAPVAYISNGEAPSTTATHDEPQPYPVVISGPHQPGDTEATAPQKIVSSAQPANTAHDRRSWQQRTRRDRPLIPEVPTPVAPRPSIPSRTVVPTQKPAPQARETDAQSNAGATRRSASTSSTPQQPPSTSPTRQRRDSHTPPAPAPAPVTRSRPNEQASVAQEPATTSDGSVPNVNRIMANLRKQIQQKLPSNTPPVAAPRASGRSNDDVHRFVVGQRIFCLPYGDGEIVDSFFVDGREYIRVDFPNYGELKIDPAVSLVKILSEDNQPDTE